MNNRICENLAEEMGLETWQVEGALRLFGERCTPSFVARYRKEATGDLDDACLRSIHERYLEDKAIEERRGVYSGVLIARGLLSGDLETRIAGAQTIEELEDAYLPYRPKNRTRAQLARERGLEALAVALVDQSPERDPRALAEEALAQGADAATPDEALMGARDLIAEFICEDPIVRSELRSLFRSGASIQTRLVPGADDDPRTVKYREYFDYDEPFATLPPHRYMAIRRAENRRLVTVEIRPEEGEALALMRSLILLNDSPSAREVDAAIVDCYRRLLCPHMEGECVEAARRMADRYAMDTFAINLTSLLLAPALGDEPVLALDPGYVSGCQVVAVGRDGELLEFMTIFPDLGPDKRLREAKEGVLEMILRHGIEYVAVGTGPGGRLTENLVRSIPGLPERIKFVPINEGGATVYSISEIGREEMPDHDLSVRAAVSIARQLKDPLSELVKIDPRSVGVGQYQQDVDQHVLKERLEQVMATCVNAVGCDLNRASP